MPPRQEEYENVRNRLSSRNQPEKTRLQPWFSWKPPNTAHRHDVSDCTIVTRKGHALEGRTLPVINTITRRGIHYLLAVLPDGSRSLIPSSWTNYKLQPVEPGEAYEAADDLGRIGDLLRLRKLVDALQQKEELMSIPNVNIYAKRVTPIDKHKSVGRWKVIDQELTARELPVTGHEGQDHAYGHYR